jgi:hypothetical protein
MQQGHDRIVAELLESDTRGKVRLPALHIAAKKNDVKAATLLLEVRSYFMKKTLLLILWKTMSFVQATAHQTIHCRLCIALILMVGRSIIELQVYGEMCCCTYSTFDSVYTTIIVMIHFSLFVLKNINCLKINKLNYPECL